MQWVRESWLGAEWEPDVAGQLRLRLVVVVALGKVVLIDGSTGDRMEMICICLG